MQVGQLFSKASASARLTNHKGFLRQLIECALLFLHSRLGPGFYYLAGLDEHRIPLKDVLGFASVKAYNAAVHRANDTSYHRASQHKAIEKAVLTCYHVPTSELIAYLHRRRGRAVLGSPVCTGDAVVDILRELAPDAKLCIKQANAWGGAGFRVIKVAAGGEQVVDLGSDTTHDSRSYFNDVLDSSPDGAVLELYLEQHRFYAALNPSSINSYRVLIWDRDGVERPWLLAFLRVGRDGALVDNASSGGLICPVNSETGLLEAGFQKYGERTRYESHPDSGQRLHGVEPLHFDEAVELALTAVRAFPGIRFAGVDIAMSVEGPVVLELNVWPDYAGFAYCQLPSRPSFTSLV